MMWFRRLSKYCRHYYDMLRYILNQDPHPQFFVYDCSSVFGVMQSGPFAGPMVGSMSLRHPVHIELLDIGQRNS